MTRAAVIGTGLRPVRLVATDLDGTLVRSDETVSEASRDAIAAAERAGLEIVFVTGRPTRWLWQVADAVGYTGIVVAANGAVTYDLGEQRVIDERVLDARTLTDVTTRLRARFPDVYFAADSGDGFAHEPGYAHDWQITPTLRRDGSAHPKPLIADLDEILGPRCVKLLARVHNANPDAFLAEAERLLGDTVYITHSASSGLLEISAPGVTKASGLRRYCDGLGIHSSEVAAVGDMPNDIPMLRWAGRSYAVANAHPAAQQAAGTVLADSNDSDAVAKLITGFLPVSSS